MQVALASEALIGWRAAVQGAAVPGSRPACFCRTSVRNVLLFREEQAALSWRPPGPVRHLPLLCVLATSDFTVTSQPFAYILFIWCVELLFVC